MVDAPMGLKSVNYQYIERVIIVFDILCFSGLVPNVITPSLMGAYNPWTPNTTQPKD